MKKFTMYGICAVVLVVVVITVAIPLVAQAIIFCSGGNCSYMACRTNSDCGYSRFTGSQTCEQNNNVYQNYVSKTCNNPGTLNSYCSTSITYRHQQTCQNGFNCQYGACVSAANTVSLANSSCIPHTSQKCVTNGTTSGIFWFDSCGNQQENYQQCSTGQTCSLNACVTAQPTYNPHATKGCVGNTAYWYDSNGSRQESYQTCDTGTTCSAGQCVNNRTPPPIVPTSSGNTFVKHSRADCYNNNLYWYSSWGSVQDVKQSCQDSNACTIDTCADGQCGNALKCDGSTCATNSADYAKFCNEVKTEVKTPNNNLTASVTENASIIEFVKRWYGWLLAIIVLVILFVIIFRRLSSHV